MLVSARSTVAISSSIRFPVYIEVLRLLNSYLQNYSVRYALSVCFPLCTPVFSVVQALKTDHREHRGTQSKATDLYFFRCPQFCAARPRVAIDLSFTSGHWLFCQQLVLTQLRALAHRVLHDAVFQRVKADHH